MKEVEMYKPLKKFLEKRGYIVHAEVEGVDVMAKKGDELVIVEMKIAFNMQLVYQLIERLKITDQVYAYVPLKKGGRWPKSYKRMCGLLKRLNCGLITLDEKTRKEVVLEFEPSEFVKRKNYAKKKLAMKEFEGRRVDLNQAGSTKKLIFTVYKEKAIQVAMYLFEHGASSAAEIKTNLNLEKAAPILRDNHQGWFEKVSRGVYRLSPEFEFFRLKNKKKIKKLQQG